MKKPVQLSTVSVNFKTMIALLNCHRAYLKELFTNATANHFKLFDCVQTSCPRTDDVDFCKDDFYEGFTMGDVDMTFENYEELFGASHNQTGDLFDDAGIDSFFDMKENSATNSICHGESAEEVYHVAFSAVVAHCKVKNHNLNS